MGGLEGEAHPRVAAGVTGGPRSPVRWQCRAKGHGPPTGGGRPTQGFPAGENPTCPEFLRLCRRRGGGKRVPGTPSRGVPRPAHMPLTTGLSPPGTACSPRGILPRSRCLHPASTRAEGPQNPDTPICDPQLSQGHVRPPCAQRGRCHAQSNPTYPSHTRTALQKPPTAHGPTWAGGSHCLGGLLQDPPPPSGAASCLRFPMVAAPVLSGGVDGLPVPPEQLWLLCQRNTPRRAGQCRATLGQQPAPRGQRA